MWRSFFYAIGIGLLLLGGQSLILDHVVTARKMKVPAAIKEIVNGGPAAAGQRLTGQPVGYTLNNNANRPPTMAQPQAQSQVGRLTEGQSRFGPSRFSGPQYGHYGGARADASAYGSQAFNRNGAINTNSGSEYFRQANFAPNVNNTNAGLIATGSPANGANKAGPISQRIVQARDWMPWCLLAAGTIVILYTNSWRPRHND